MRNSSKGGRPCGNKGHKKNGYCKTHQYQFEDKKEIQKSPDLHDESNLVYIPKHVPDDNKEWYANENSEPCIPIILFNTFWTFISL